MDLKNYNIVHHVVGGSRQYGTDTSDSDYDFRCIYVRPTRTILSEFTLEPKSNIQIIQGKFDYRLLEVGHFFRLLSQSNPNAIEILYSNDVHGRDFFKRIKDIYFHIFDGYKFRKACIGMATSAIMDYERTGNPKYALEATRIVSMCKIALENDVLVLNINSHECYQRVLKPMLADKRNEIFHVNKAYVQEYDKIMDEIKKIDLEPIEPDIGLLKSELYEIRTVS